jgi:hypothetical protein
MAIMQPDEVEQMLFEHAIKTNIRAPMPERLSNLGYNRIVTSGIVAGAALVCSLVMSKSASTLNANNVFGGLGQPQLTDNANQRTNFHQQGAESTSASLAMSPVGG